MTEWKYCGNDPKTGQERYISYGKFQTRVTDAFIYCQRLETFYMTRGKVEMVSIPDQDMDWCVYNLLKDVSSYNYPAVATLGATFQNTSDTWVWADGNQMSSANDYNNCA